MNTSASLVSVHLAGAGKDEISLDTLPGKFTVTRTDEVGLPLASQTNTSTGPKK
jgi:hypothetical protein